MGSFQSKREAQYRTARRQKIIKQALTFSGLAALTAVTAFVVVEAVAATGWH